MKESQLIVRACELAHEKLMKINRTEHEEDLMYFDQKEGMLFYKDAFQVEFDALYKFYYEQLKKGEIND